jgi:hypothetical protein
LEELEKLAKKVLVLIWDKTPLGTSPKKSASGSENTTQRSRRVEAKPG